MSENIFCPDCKIDYRITKFGVKRFGSILELIERNYSGCSVDIYECPKCKHCFQVSYKVDKIERVKDWEFNE